MKFNNQFTLSKKRYQEDELNVKPIMFKQNTMNNTYTSLIPKENDKNNSADNELSQGEIQRPKNIIRCDDFNFSDFESSSEEELR